MNIEKPDRIKLKSYFVKNAIPIEGNFADLIDGLINQKDDGIVKLAGEPLSVQADGNDTSLKKAINFYKNFADPKPAWTLSLNPRVDPTDAATAKPGWSIGDADGNSKLFIDQTTGNVGVGTTTPAGKLEVNGAAVISNGNSYATKNNFMAPGSLTVGGAATNYGGGKNGWNSNTAGLMLETLKNTEIAAFDAETRVASLMYYEGDAPNRITIGRDMGWGAISQVVLNGNVGIGTTPSQRLHVAGGNGVINNAFVGDVGHGPDWAAFSHSNSATPPGYGFLHHTSGQYALINKKSGAGFIGLRIDNADKMVLNDNGNVGIGTTNPQTTLEISSGFGTEALRFGHSTIDYHSISTSFHGESPSQNYLGFNVEHTSGDVRRVLTLQGDGTVKVNILQLGDKWRLSGVGDHEANDDWLRLKNSQNTAYRGGFAAFLLWSNGGVVQGSDLRYKSDIRPIDEAIERILSIRGVAYKWKSHDEHVGGDQIGLIAQEVEEVFPEVVSTGPDGMKGINYSALIAPLIEAVKQQQAQINELRAEVQTVRPAN